MYKLAILLNIDARGGEFEKKSWPRGGDLAKNLARGWGYVGQRIEGCIIKMNNKPKNIPSKTH